MTQLNVKVKRLHPDAALPAFATEGSAGFDLVAVEDVIIEPGETAKVPLGLAFELPPGYEMQIRPRSGVTLKTKLRVQLGTVDADYRGEVSAIVDNVSINEGERRQVDVDSTYKLVHVDGTESRLGVMNKSPVYRVRKGDRICQAIISKLPTVIFDEVFHLNDSNRGDDGFGSTGIN